MACFVVVCFDEEADLRDQMQWYLWIWMTSEQRAVNLQCSDCQENGNNVERSNGSISVFGLFFLMH